MNNSFDVTTIIFAALALFVVWKLRSVLGTRTGHERRPDQNPRNRPTDDRDNGKVVRLPGSNREQVSEPTQLRAADENKWAGLAERGSAAWNGLDELDRAEKGFDAAIFLDGAKGAYEMIITAFASGDRTMLRDLISKDVFDSFAQAISDRSSKGERVETTFVSIDQSKIEDVQIKDGSAQITVAFDSKLITATYDRSNNLIDGDPEKIVDVADVWTFAREIAASDPNWRLIAT